ncbi:unnamed protein product [Lasius platythorax]|uniref:Secreted protein n=1 Tax=Lasius platythorax TaxID=488582 RepID=A0AAV2MYY5_9HYME
MRWPVWLAPVHGLTEGYAGVGSLGGEMRIGSPNFILWSTGSSCVKPRMSRCLRAGCTTPWSTSHHRISFSISRFGLMRSLQGSVPREGLDN